MYATQSYGCLDFLNCLCGVESYKQVPQQTPSRMIQYEFEGKYKEATVIASENGFEICRDDGCELTEDPKARELHKLVKITYHFFKTKFDLEGVNNEGELPNFVIHWDKDNAVWTCPGSKESCHWKFHNKYITLEIVVHEWMHAIASRINPLKFDREPGAIEESLGDVMGITARHWQWRKEGIQTRNWVIADRDISKPTTIGNFRKLLPKEKPSEENDHGHVHENSMILSHAFYLLASDVQVGDDKASMIWYRTFRAISSEASFLDFANTTLDVAKDRSLNCESLVTAAWDRIGFVKEENSDENSDV